MKNRMAVKSSNLDAYIHTKCFPDITIHDSLHDIGDRTFMTIRVSNLFNVTSHSIANIVQCPVQNCDKHSILMYFQQSLHTCL